MPFQILINIFIAVLWMFLQNDWSASTFTLGYLLGLGLIFMFRRSFNHSFYLRRVWALFVLFLIFNKELIHSSVVVIGQILRPKLNINPGIFQFDTELKSNWEITTLALLLMLTPGSVVMEVSPNGQTFYMHAMDIPISSDMVLSSKERFERAIMEVTR
ncbi:multicomponent Na+:H+ antiporter subunit E [Geomicrobium halophilum]|uniref:Multicomponent Na+:H+ antiporter subunit E n=1 Tax=Geomicrobium halophilum TaxID=549000 RepID=A0A841PQZ3_9BACL|nr:Na+/H+ antiporter subunit E [Geomicrobium halophilum]MBB6451210.1 multicomponent Na+:H+ antiporter subunit E [Geomicrobium halophilum]